MKKEKKKATCTYHIFLFLSPSLLIYIYLVVLQYISIIWYILVYILYRYRYRSYILLLRVSLTKSNKEQKDSKVSSFCSFFFQRFTSDLIIWLSATLAEFILSFTVFTKIATNFLLLKNVPRSPKIFVSIYNSVKRQTYEVTIAYIIYVYLGILSMNTL